MNSNYVTYAILENIFGDCVLKDDVLYSISRILRDIRLLHSARQSAGELSRT